MHYNVILNRCNVDHYHPIHGIYVTLTMNVITRYNANNVITRYIGAIHVNILYTKACGCCCITHPRRGSVALHCIAAALIKTSSTIIKDI